MPRPSDARAGARRIAIPVLAYVVITLALPAANGAWARDDFVRHAAWVLLGCAAAVTVSFGVGSAVGATRSLAGRLRQRTRRLHPCPRGGRT